MKNISFVILFLSLYSIEGLCQTPMLTDADIDAPVNVSLPVGKIESSHGVSGGNSNYTIPIKVLPGYSSLEPKLALTYNSGMGNGLLGWGWNLSGLSTIHRSNQSFSTSDKAAPISGQNVDRFSIDGNDLLPIQGNNGESGTIYRTLNETFIQIEGVGQNTTQTFSYTDYFKVVGKDGLVSLYGSTDNSKHIVEGVCLSWLISKVYDLNGNYMEFEYETIDTEIRIREIRYNGNSTTNLLPYSKVRFNYTNNRIDESFSYTAGVKVKSKSLLQTIVVVNDNQDVFTYELLHGYDDTRRYSFVNEVNLKGRNNEYLNSTKFKYHDPYSNGIVGSSTSSTYNLPTSQHLHSGRKRGLVAANLDGDGKTDLVSFIYDISNAKQWVYAIEAFISDGEGGFNLTHTYVLTLRMGQPVNYETNWFGWTTNGWVGQFVPIPVRDFDGDGIDEIYVPSGGSLQKFTYNTTTESLVAHGALVQPGAALDFSIYGDFDGNGKQERFSSWRQLYGVGPYSFIHPMPWGPNHSWHFLYLWEPTGNRGWVRQGNTAPLGSNRWTCDGITSYDNEQRFDKVIPFSYDGDSKMEVFMFDADPYCFQVLSLGKANPADSYYTTFPLSTAIYQNGMLLPRLPNGTRDMIPGDFNGDGKTDFLVKVREIDQYPYPTEWHILYSTGNGFDLVEISFPTQNNVPMGLPILADFNGDGKTDVLDRNEMFYSTGNSNFIRKPMNTLVPNTYMFNHDRMLYGDFNGDERMDIIDVSDVNINQFGIVFQVQFNPNDKERLLHKVRDGFGNKIEFQYESIARGGHTRGNTNAFPLLSVQIPLVVVKSMKEISGVDNPSVTYYNYEDAILHKQGRGLLGFRAIETRNALYDILDRSESMPLSNNFSLIPIRNKRRILSTGTIISDVTYFSSTHLTSHSPYSFKVSLDLQISYNPVTGLKETSQFLYTTEGGMSELRKQFGTLNQTAIWGTETTTFQHQQFFASGRTLELVREKTFTKVVGVSPPDNEVVQFTYYPNTLNLLQRTTFPGLPKEVKEEFEYNDLGLPTKSTESAAGLDSRIKSLEYNARGQLIIETNPLLQETHTTYEPVFGKVASVTTPDGLNASVEYDNFGRDKKTTDEAGNVIFTTRQWDLTNGYLYYVEENTIGQPTERTWYDIKEREAKTEVGGYGSYPVVAYKTYNSKGQLRTSKSPATALETPETSTYTYDQFGRCTTIVVTNQGVTTMGYAMANGLTTISQTETSGQWVKRTIDGTGMLVSAEDAGGVLTYEYNSQGQQTKVKMNGAIINEMIYDQYGRQVQLKDKNAGNIDYEYDAFGQLIFQQDPKGSTNYSYNVLGQLIEETGTKGTTIYEYHDTPGQASLNQPRYINAFSGITTEFEYDWMGNLSNMSEDINGEVFETMAYYNSWGQPFIKIYPSGLGLFYKYNTKGYLEKIINLNTGEEIFKGVKQNGLGQWTEYNLGNGRTTTKMYNAHGTPIETKTGLLLYLKYNFDPTNLNLLTKQDRTFTSNPSSAPTESFSYDAMERLTKMQVVGLPEYKTLFHNNGNINHKDDAGDYQYDPAKIHAVVQVTTPQNISYAQQDIDYTAFSQPDQIRESGYKMNFKYGYDEERRQTVLFQNGQWLRTRIYQGDYERTTHANGNVTEVHYIDAEGELVAMVVRENGGGFEAKYVYTDYLGSILKVTNAQGNVVAEQNFDAWGRSRNPQTWAYANVPATPAWLYRGYTGHEHLPEFALINMNGRLYDPVLGRMLSPDNFVSSPLSTQAYNRYSYVLNNPLKYTDPSGETPDPFWTALRTYYQAYSGDLPMWSLTYPPIYIYGKGTFYNVEVDNQWRSVTKLELFQLGYSNVGVHKQIMRGDFGRDLGTGYFITSTRRSDIYQLGGDFMNGLVWAIPDAMSLGGTSFARAGATKLALKATVPARVLTKPTFAAGSRMTINSGKSLANAGKNGLTNFQLVQKAATKAEKAIGGVGPKAGTNKHTYATKLLDRYQRRFGDRQLATNHSFNNGVGNRGFLDVLDNSNGVIYDFKFGKAVMNSTQFSKYTRNFNLPIVIIRP